MDIRKMITLCAGCVPSNHLCMAVRTPPSSLWFTHNSNSNSNSSLAEDGGVCLADYSPNGEMLCAFSNVMMSDEESLVGDDLESPDSLKLSTYSSSTCNDSFECSNEAMAEKSSMISSSSDCGGYTDDTNTLSLDSHVSNEARANTFTNSSYSCSLSGNAGSLQSFDESSCGGEGLASEESSSSDTSDLIDSLEVFSDSLSTPLPKDDT